MGLDSMFYCVLRTMFLNVYVVLFCKWYTCMDDIYTFSWGLFMMARTASGLMGGKSCIVV